MKPLTRKTLWSTVILTAGFSLVLLAGPALVQGDPTKLAVLRAVVMSIAVVASALVWPRVQPTRTITTGNADWKNLR